MAPRPDATRFLNGVPELLVLQLLSRRGEMYGYEIVGAVYQSTGGAVTAGEGSIYPILHSMTRRKWITSRRATNNGRTRIYYRLTDKGRAQLASAAGRWAQVSAAVNRVLGIGGSDGKPASPAPAGR
jgi:PadR family transcriptional regulator PadR